MQYIFLDTNIFLHFVDYDQIDWTAAIGNDQPFIIAISGTVINELDQHKYHKSPKISRRAKRILPKIEGALEHLSNTGMQLQDILSIPPEDVFIQFALNKQDSDDRLLAEILTFQQKLSAEDSIILFTNDSGPRLKARRLKLTALKIPDQYLLPNEPDENELQIKELQKELNEYKNKMPVVSLLFANQTELLIKDLKKAGELISSSEFVKRELEKIKEKYPLQVYREIKPVQDSDDLSQIASRLNFQFLAVSEEQVKSYNEELAEYYKNYEAHAAELYSQVLFAHHCIPIEFVLQNTGTAPAVDIDIELHFPDGFALLEKESLPKKKRVPEPPYLPKNRFDLKGLTIPSIFPPSFDGGHFRSVGPVNASSPSIRQTNSYDVSYHVKMLKHNQPITLDKLFAKFENINAAKGFAIDYRLKISNVTKMVTGCLHVKINNVNTGTNT